MNFLTKDFFCDGLLSLKAPMYAGSARAPSESSYHLPNWRPRNRTKGTSFIFLVENTEVFTLPSAQRFRLVSITIKSFSATVLGMGERTARGYKMLVHSEEKACMLKFPNGRIDHEILSMSVKPKSKYLRVECRVSETRANKLQSSESGKWKKITFGGFGARPKRKMYLSQISHQESAVLMREVSDVFCLQPLFDEDDSEARESTIASGIQFIKIESREELEYRRKSINHLLKVFYNEDYTRLGCQHTQGAPDGIEGFRPISAGESIVVPEDRRSDISRLQKIIFNSRIVNLRELSKVSRHSNIKEVAMEMAAPFQGRLVLRNTFYDCKLQAVRQRILQVLASHGHISHRWASELPEKYLFLLEELCDRTAEGYYLKGYDEKLGLEDERFDVEDTYTKIHRVLLQQKMATVENLGRLFGMQEDEVRGILRHRSFIRLSNNCYSTYPQKDTDPSRKLVLDLFSKKSVVRMSEIVKAVNMAREDGASIEKVAETLLAYCDRQENAWALKRG